MAVSHRGAISFGLVHIPVGLYTTTRSNSNALSPPASGTAWYVLS